MRAISTRLRPVADSPRYRFVQADIADRAADAGARRRVPARRGHAPRRREPRRPLDRRPGRVRRTPTCVGTYALLAGRPRLLARARPARAATPSASSTSRPTRCSARWAPTGCSTRRHAYDPNSPYSATKAASDHLVRAWHHTYGLPVLLTNCSNNYGPYQFPEKLIPLMILNAPRGQAAAGLRRGENVRDWLYRRRSRRGAASLVAEQAAGRARPTTSAAAASGATSTSSTRSAAPRGRNGAATAARSARARQLITLSCADRPGHDLRYAIDAAQDRARTRLARRPRPSRAGCARRCAGIWSNRAWWERVRSGVYRGERLGVAV